MKGKRLLIGLACIFFAVMAVFTGISRHIALSALTKVETAVQFQEIKVPEELLFEKADGKTYVQTVRAEPSILGEQYVVEEVEVKVLQRQNGEVFLDTGDFHYEIIVDGEAEVFAGEKVRKE